ncbi:MAG: gamma-glutamyltransferase [Proteobacteria bacterium]|nr:gamma-glutamyltransferase [Pseudomonadota bacterium]
MRTPDDTTTPPLRQPRRAAPATGKGRGLGLLLALSAWVVDGGHALARTERAATEATRPSTAAVVAGTHGVVATDHPLASAAGLEVLRAGGNAIDAACAAMFALGIVNPAGSGLGGGGLLLLRPAGSEAPLALDFRETAPGAATREMFSRAGVDAEASAVGGLAVAVPGEVQGCATALARFGRLGLRRVLRPAIRLARRGFEVGPYLALLLQHEQRGLRRSKALGRTYLPDGVPLRAGQRLRRPRLATTLEAIARQGPRVFYRGWIARDLVASVRRAGGQLAAADLAGYRPVWRKVLSTRFGRFTVFGFPPPSSGGTVILGALNVLQQRDLRGLGHNSAAYLHLLAETLKHTFADRARLLGDSDFVAVPVDRLLSKASADQLNQRIGYHVVLGASYGLTGEAPRAPSGGRGGTSHLSVVDAEGMAVALTTSINTSFGAFVVGARSDIVLNNTMDDFAARPGEANAFGLVQSETNAIAPGKRPLSSMAPTIVTRDGQVYAVLGGSGGPTILSATLQVLLNVLAFELPPGEAVSRPRLHHQWLPNQLSYEPAITSDVLEDLKQRGHRLRLIRRPPDPYTAVQLVTVEGANRLGASDPRKFGAPAAY